MHRTGSGNDASPNSIGLIIRGRGWVHVINAGGEKLNRWISVEYRCVECGSEQGMVAQNHFVVEDVVGGSFGTVLEGPDVACIEWRAKPPIRIILFSIFFFFLKLFFIYFPTSVFPYVTMSTPCYCIPVSTNVGGPMFCV